jgi:hypothetical protein
MKGLQRMMVSGYNASWRGFAFFRRIFVPLLLLFLSPRRIEIWKRLLAYDFAY